MVEGGAFSLSELDALLPYEKEIYLQFMVDRAKQAREGEQRESFPQ